MLTDPTDRSEVVAGYLVAEYGAAGEAEVLAGVGSDPGPDRVDAGRWPATSPMVRASTGARCPAGAILERSTPAAKGASMTREPADAGSDRLIQLEQLLRVMPDAELAKAWARCMRALHSRGMIRSSNGPVGDYAEVVACQCLGLARKDQSAKSVDAVDPAGKRYQIKGRRLTPWNQSRELGAMRDVASGPFDSVLAVFFDEELELQEIWEIPCEVVQEARVVQHTNATKFVVTQKVRSDPRVTRLYPPLPG
ncbi:MAG: DUF6998 domain-containing protein [Acidimicrobiia bacterium]